MLQCHFGFPLSPERTPSRQKNVVDVAWLLCWLFVKIMSFGVMALLVGMSSVWWCDQSKPSFACFLNDAVVGWCILNCSLFYGRLVCSLLQRSNGDIACLWCDRRVFIQQYPLLASLCLSTVSRLQELYFVLKRIWRRKSCIRCPSVLINKFGSSVLQVELLSPLLPNSGSVGLVFDFSCPISISQYLERPCVGYDVMVKNWEIVV